MSVDILTDISVEIYIYISVDISVEAPPICRSTSRPIYRSRGVGQASVDVSTDMSTSMSAAMSTDARQIRRSI